MSSPGTGINVMEEEEEDEDDDDGDDDHDDGEEDEDDSGDDRERSRVDRGSIDGGRKARKRRSKPAKTRIFRLYRHRLASRK